MKKAVALAVAAVASVGLLAGCSSNNEATKKVDPVEFSEVIAQPGVIILDVRTQKNSIRVIFQMQSISMLQILIFPAKFQS
jgi:hypothetical protein